MLALEDALSRGLPIQKEIDALCTYLDGIEKDSVLDLVISSLPVETWYRGTETLQLNQKINQMKDYMVVDQPEKKSGKRPGFPLGLRIILNFALGWFEAKMPLLSNPPPNRSPFLASHGYLWS